jgi:hypothetical protein
MHGKVTKKLMLKQTKMPFVQKLEQEDKTDPVWRLVPERGKGYKERV